MLPHCQSVIQQSSQCYENNPKAIWRTSVCIQICKPLPVFRPLYFLLLLYFFITQFFPVLTDFFRSKINTETQKKQTHTHTEPRQLFHSSQIVRLLSKGTNPMKATHSDIRLTHPSSPDSQSLTASQQDTEQLMSRVFTGSAPV